MNKVGIHLHGPAEDVDSLYSVGFGCYTILDIDIEHYITDILHHIDQPLILLRTYHPNVLSMDPKTWAEHGYRMLDRWTGNITHITPGNELNLPGEGGGSTPADYARIDAWLQAWSYHMRRLCPWAVLHWPALSPPGVGYEADAMLAMHTSLEMFDVLDVHCYWLPTQTGITPHSETAQVIRLDLLHKLAPPKPIFVSEFNRQFAPDDRYTGTEYQRFYERILERPYIIGATSFVWSSPDPAFTAYEWVNNPSIAAAIRAMPKTTQQEGETTVPDATQINLPEIIRAAIVTHAAANGLSVELVGAVCYQESGFNPTVIGDNGHSVGLMQLHDQGAGAGMSVAERQNIDINLGTGTRYLRAMIDVTGTTEDGLSAYNQGLYGWRQNGRATNWVYVDAVLAHQRRFVAEDTFAAPTAPASNPDVEEIAGQQVAYAFLKEYRRRGRSDGAPRGPAAYCGDECLQSFESDAVYIWAGSRVHVLNDTV